MFGNKTNTIIIVAFVAGAVLGWGAKTMKVEAALMDGYVTKEEYNNIVKKLNYTLNQQNKQSRGRIGTGRKQTGDIPINLHPDKTGTIMEWKSNLKR